MNNQKNSNNYDKVLTVNCPTVLDFFNIWLKLIPTLKLRDKELEVASTMLDYWYRLSKKYTDKKDLIVIFNSNQIRDEIADKCCINQRNFNVNLTNLKKAGFCCDVDSKQKSTIINARYIPDFDENNKSFCFILNFRINEIL